MMSNTIVLPASQPDAIQQALLVLSQDGTVAFPTDTVYGLAANPYSVTAIQKLFQIKDREKEKSIAVLLGNIKQLNKVTQNPSKSAIELAQAHWPGALTLVIPRHTDMPDELSPLPTLGVRIPDHPVALALLQASGPLAVTSANISGQADTSTAEEVLAQLNGRVDLILDGGKTPGGVPSTVVDMTGATPKVLRQGPILIN